MAEFHEVLFPPNISYGSSGGARFKTTIFTADSGYEQRNIDWAQPRGEWDVAHSMRDLQGSEQLSSIEELAAFFMARNGRMHGFRFRDPADCTIEDQLLGVGDGATLTFPFIKSYRSYQSESGSDTTFNRKIKKLQWNSVTGVRVGGVLMPPQGYTIDHNAATITFAAAPAAAVLGAGGAVITPAQSVVIGDAVFHHPARFDTDHCDVTADFWNTASWPSIPIIELR